MKVADIIQLLESLAPPFLQESYDNAGLLTGKASQSCTGVLCCLDVTEAVLTEAMAKGCNMVVAHHPLIFGGIKQINGKNTVERTLIQAIKNDIAVYAIHTNLDNMLTGVNGKMAELLGLQNCRVLWPKENSLQKLVTFVPVAQAEQVKTALFEAGAGEMGKYSECSFSVNGQGSFTANDGANPYVGKIGSRHLEPECRIEVILPTVLTAAVVKALLASHPYEEVAYDIYPLQNTAASIGSGLIGELQEPLTELDFFKRVSEKFNLSLIRHTALLGNPIQKVALCGGAGSFLISRALATGAQVFLTADLKYHDFFLADNRMVLADMGHFESEQFTMDLLQERLAEKFPTFAVLKTSVFTNPVNYLWQP